MLYWILELMLALRQLIPFFPASYKTTNANLSTAVSIDLYSVYNREQTLILLCQSFVMITTMGKEPSETNGFPLVR
jgi:hypothetical protein